MTIAEQIAQIASNLPADRQMEVLDFVEFLEARTAKSALAAREAGLFAGLPYSMADDFDDPLAESFWTGGEP